MHFCFSQQETTSTNSTYQHALDLHKNQKQEKALQIALEQIEITPKNSSQKAEWLQLIGIIFKEDKEFDKGLDYFRKSYAINTKLQDSLALMLNHIYIGQIYQLKFNDLYEARFSEKATILKDSANFYYKKNITSFSKVNKGIIHTASSYFNLAYIYSDLDQLEKAQYYNTKAITIYKSKLNSTTELNGALINQGLIYIYQKNYSKAEKTYLEFLGKTQDTSNIKALKYTYLATSNLSYIYKKTDQYKKAYTYVNKSTDLLDIITQKQKAIEITLIEATHNEEKARAEEKVNTVREEKEKERTQYILAGTGLTSLAIILFGTILYRNSKLKAKNLSLSLVEQELNQQKTLQVLQQKNQSKLLNATLDGRETERKEIAQTLHDSVSALLSSANMHLQVVKKKATNSIEELDKSQRIINEASGKVRDLSHKLISAVLLKFGLEHAVYDMCEKYSNQDLEFELESEDKIPRFNQDFEIKIHNIIEECINNIMKHSKASEASVMLLLTNNTLHVTITDNGVGFDASKISPSSGIGLSQIKARIENMEGVFNIDSKINHGTSIVMQVPVENT
jgi:signal transduction histidine kinase